MKEFFYDIDLLWRFQEPGVISTHGHSTIEVETSLRHPTATRNKWTYEQFMAASVSSCLMSTFLSQAELAGIPVKSYQSQCFIRLIKKDDGFHPDEILIRPSVKLFHEKDILKAFNIMEKTEAIFPVRKFLNIAIKVHPQIDSAV